jgi:PKD repeat protein
MLAALTLAATSSVAAVEAVSAASGSVPAAAVHVKAMHPSGFVPRRGTPAAVRTDLTIAGSNPNCSSCAPPLLFSTDTPVAGGLTGSPGHVTITPVYWAPTGYSFTTNYKTIVNGYLANVAADSNKASNVFAVETQYYQHLTAQAQKPIRYVVVAGSEIDFTEAFPAQNISTGCVADSGYSACVADGALQSELQTKLTALAKPVDDAHLYMVFFPRLTSNGNPVETCQANGSSATQACSSNVYCAYHSGFYLGSGNQYLLYGNEPFPDLNGCTGGLGPQAPNGDTYADAELSPLSHEANETISDWAGAWYDSAGYENGDECAYVYGTNGGSTLVSVPDGLNTGTAYNQTINGAHYYTQDEFSNADFGASAGDVVEQGSATHVFGCLQKEEAPTAVFSVPLARATISVGFNGSGSSDPDGSIATYTWIWGDGTANSTGVAPSHTFATASTFSVTLTVRDVDGWPRAVTHSVIVYPVGATVPGAPTSVVGTPGHTTASLTWTAPVSNGGAAITKYRVFPYIGATAQASRLTPSAATSFIVTGLTTGVHYTFKVSAVNAFGTGTRSAASNTVTPT